MVGIGASAGGLEALMALFTALPDDLGMALVVVSHLDPVHPSELADILGRHSRLKVTEAQAGETIEANRVYVLPPGQDMTLEAEALHLEPRSTHALHRPIDLFLRSLAEARGHQAIGVILSGTASDGTLGLRAVKEAGGITFAQDDSAQQRSMPHSAIADGFVDFVLAPADIAAELMRISRTPLSPGVPEDWGRDEAAIHRILQAVHRKTGVDFTHYKAGTLRRRLQRRMILNRVDSLTAYADFVRATPGEPRTLHDDLLIGVTSFFRDPESFKTLARAALMRLVRTERDHEPVRVWVLGCSTGEEAYSLAIALTECAEEAGRVVPIQIFASDVNASGIDVARRGVYPADIVQDVSPERLDRYFLRVDGEYRVVKSLRDACVFSRHNVLTDPPFSRIDLVSCRNLLIYLEPVLQDNVVNNLHYALREEGVLWLGTADSIGNHDHQFETADGPHKVFRRRPGSVSHPAIRPATSRLSHAKAHFNTSGSSRAIDVLRESDRVMLSRFAPAGVVVSPAMEVLQYRGDVGPYVSPAPGRAGLHVTQVLDRQLQVPVRAAITRAQIENRTIREEELRVARHEGEAVTVTIEVIPLGAPAEGFLVLFERAQVDGHPVLRGRSGEPPSAHEMADVDRLARQLADTQSYVHSLVEQHETAREELEVAHEEAQSANEELQSINEELETSKEEIQSANEELSTLNEELRHRNEELQVTNSDLVNLLSSSELAVVFVNRELAIRRFTPPAATVFGLRSGDVGRQLRDLTLGMSVDVHRQIADTLRTLDNLEQDVQDRHGHWWSVRTKPYRTLDNQVEGVVLVLVDIDALVKARLYAESIVATARAPLVVLDEALTVVTANDAFHRAFLTDANKTQGHPFFELSQNTWDVPALRRLLLEVLPLNHVVKDFELIITQAATGRRVWMLDARRLVQAENNHPLMLLSMEDVSERQHAEGLRRQRVLELAHADQNKNEFLAMLAHELRNPLAPIRTAAQMLGMPGIPTAVSENARLIIDRQLRNMVRLIDDLLDVARITQGKLDLQLAPLDLTGVIRRAIDVVDRQVQERTQRLSVSLPDDGLYVLGDATRLEQVFGNLLNNASKFTKAGGHVSVRLVTKDTAHGRDVYVHVQDDGVGIHASTLPHIFQMFKQGGPSPHRAPGLGVGLALVRQIVEMHGGRVSAHSDGAGRGSEFVVCLPLLQDDHKNVERAPVTVTPTAGQRVLVVDDNLDAAESLTALLRAQGHDVRMAHDAPAALEIAPTFIPAVVFLDIWMPGMDGYELARRLRRIPSLESALLIAVTGFGREEDRGRAHDAGIDRHVTKPLDPLFLPALMIPPSEGRREPR